MHRINLDHNATTPLLPEAALAMAAAPAGNPSSAHYAGRAARRALEDAREQIAALLGAQPDEVNFTSGATESNNLAIMGVSSLAGSAPRHILASALEHSCVIEPLKQLAARGHNLEWFPVIERGFVAIDGLFSRIVAETSLICLMLANHETGAVQPVREVAARIPNTIALHCDAAQAVGKIGVNFRELGVSTLAASAHKFRGPMGIGLLLLKRGTHLKPLMFGGHQQKGHRPGTEAVPLAVGMAVALDHAVKQLAENTARVAAFRDRFWQRLQELAAPVVLNGPEVDSSQRLANTLNVSFPGCRADLLLVALDLAGLACSTGSACSSGSLLPSPVLRAMGVPDPVLHSAIRFSFGPSHDIADSNDAAERVASAVHRLRGDASGTTR